MNRLDELLSRDSSVGHYWLEHTHVRTVNTPENIRLEIIKESTN